MKKYSLHILLILVTQSLFMSCSKKDTTAAPPPHQKAVYAVGYYSKAGKYYTTVWKDGAASVLDSNAAPTDIFVNGSDLYITGQKNSKAIIWKNGVATQLNTGPAYGYVLASSVYVSGTDVHVAGMAENATTFRKQAAYWKNNVPVMLNAGANTEDSYAQSVAMSGTDVYVAGRKTITGGGDAVVLWKNGTATDLKSSATASYGNVNLYISGADVYVVCYEYDFPNVEQISVWKNGTPVTFPASVLGAVPYCLFVNGTDVYIGGFERGGTPSSTYLIPRYWKNGAPVTVGNNPAAFTDKVQSIYVDGTDEYVAGSIRNPTTGLNSARIWKNGTETQLTDGVTSNGEVFSVFVK